MAGKYTTIPLYRRPYDLLFVLIFGLSIWIALFFDSAQWFAPAGTRENWGMTREYAKTAFWPPQQYIDFLIDQCDHADHLLCVNPVWFKTLCFFPVFLYLPFYFVGVYAFIFGKDWIRLPVIFWALLLNLSLIVMTAEQKWGEYASRDFDKIFGPYVAYIFIPWFFVFRVLSKHPFSTKNVPEVKKNQ